MKKLLVATAILTSSLLAQSTVSFKDGLTVQYNDGENKDLGIKKGIKCIFSLSLHYEFVSNYTKK